MKRQTLQSIATLVFLCAFTGLNAQAQTRGALTARIPFDFYVQNQKFAAGDYAISSVSPQSNQTALVIRAKDGKAARTVIMLPKIIDAGRGNVLASLLFNRYGDEYFLAEISNPAESFGAQMARTKEERNLAQHSGKPRRETVVMPAPAPRKAIK